MAAGQQQIAIVVLGAGRSGTSAITRGLQALGVDLGPGLRPGGGKNPTGFFEDEALLALNKRLKRALGIRGSSVRLLAPEDWQRQGVETLRREAVRMIGERFGGSPVWGYKYGRTLRLLPFWLEVYRACDLDVRYVIALRNPLSVAHSRGKLDPRRGAQEKSDLEWLVNVVPYLRAIRTRPFVVTDYDSVMEDAVSQLERTAGALDLPFTAAVRQAASEYAREFLQPGMRHTRFSEADLEQAPRLNPLTRRAYRWLSRLAADRADPSDPAIWEEWREIEDELRTLAPVLRHIDRLEEDLRRAERHPLGPLQRASRLWGKVRST